MVKGGLSEQEKRGAEECEMGVSPPQQMKLKKHSKSVMSKLIDCG